MISLKKYVSIIGGIVFLISAVFFAILYPVFFVDLVCRKDPNCLAGAMAYLGGALLAVSPIIFIAGVIISHFLKKYSSEFIFLKAFLLGLIFTFLLFEVFIKNSIF